MRTWQPWKVLIVAVLGVLVAADLALIFFLWQDFRNAPESMRAQRDKLEIQAKLLRADVERGQKIRASLPQSGKDCETFYDESFLDASKGYSGIESDLGAIAAKAGVKTTGFTFKQKEIKDRGVIEITISTSVDADYPAVIQFINGLEQSKNFYLLDGLQLASASPGAIRLGLELHTYFRT